MNKRHDKIYLKDLPPEIIRAIINRVNTQAELGSLACTSRAFNFIVNEEIQIHQKIIFNINNIKLDSSLALMNKAFNHIKRDLKRFQNLLEECSNSAEKIGQLLYYCKDDKTSLREIINYIILNDKVNVLKKLLENHICSVTGNYGGKYFFCYDQLFYLEDHNSKCFELVQNANSLFGALDLEQYEEIDRIITNRPELINIKNTDGITLLYYAVCLSKKDVVINLLNKGANINIRNVSNPGEQEYGWTALHTAAVSENTELMELLLNRGANPNIQDFDGWTPLHFVLQNSYFSESVKFNITELLLKNGANPNIQNDEGDTPLHISMYQNNKDYKLIKLLIQNKADPNIENDEDNSPLDFAKSERLTDIINFIKENSQSKKRSASNNSHWVDLVTQSKKQKIEKQ